MFVVVSFLQKARCLFVFFFYFSLDLLNVCCVGAARFLIQSSISLKLPLLLNELLFIDKVFAHLLHVL